MSSHQYVYVMSRLSKAWPGGKEVLKNINLSFLPGAKIGVLGLNGAGKSTLLRIMAGIETEFQGEAWAADGIKVGYLAQEPELDASMDVTGNVLAGMGRAKELVDRFNEVSAKFAEEMTDDEMNAVIAEQAELQEEIDAIDGWDLERKAEIAMDALRVPPGDADVTKLSGGEKRRVALCKLLLSAPDMLLLTSRQTILMPNPYHGCKSFCMIFRVPSLPSPTIAISLMRLQAGFWNLIGVRAFLTKAITQVGLSRSINVLSRKAKLMMPASSHCHANFTGYVRRQRHVRPNQKPV